jgi:pentatricopeptide repeat domain-containing protein 1
MRKKGLKPNVVTFNSLIDGYAKKGDIEQARHWLVVMRKEGTKPNVIMFNTLTNRCVMKKTLKKLFNSLVD